jgi:hypothetical protein
VETQSLHLVLHSKSILQAFQKVDQVTKEESKKGFLWRLTDDAIKEGVKSTTRYRSKLPSKRTTKSFNGPSHRQSTGGRVGHASRRSKKPRRSERLRDMQNRLDDPTSLRLNAISPASYSGYHIQPEFTFAMSPSSAASSPYFLASNAQVTQNILGRNMTSTPYNSTQNMFNLASGYNTGEVVQLLSCGLDDPLFYSSSESGNEPTTPPQLETLSANSWINADVPM